MNGIGTVGEISPEELRSLMAERKEGEFVLVDVRQPQEYRQEHLPGALLLPVAEFEARLGELRPEQDYVFYCAMGARSAAAALLALDSGRFAGRLLSLRGGIQAWDGGSIAELPRVDVFSGVRNERDLLFKALDLEKAAHTLYRKVRDMSQQDAMCELMDTLIGVEVAHARVVYRYLARYWDDGSGTLPEFDALFDSLQGDVLEGGLSLDDLEPWIRGALSGECLELADLALEVELNAYDLYRALARQAAEPEATSGMGADAELIFLDLASQEKHHARMIMSRIAAFEGGGA